jgi:hypothetical protein
VTKHWQAGHDRFFFESRHQLKSVGIRHFLGYAVVQFVEALRYKLEGRGFDFRW